MQCSDCVINDLLYMLCRRHLCCLSVVYGVVINLSSHRLLIALRMSDVISSFWTMLTTAPATTSTAGYIWNPGGNVHSCDTQGFHGCSTFKMLIVPIPALMLSNTTERVPCQSENRTIPSCYSCGNYPHPSGNNIVNSSFHCWIAEGEQ